MKVTTSQKELDRALRIVGRAVRRNAPMPIQTAVLLSTEDDFLRLSATNLEIEIATTIGARVEDEGALCVPARLITDYVRTLRGEEVSIETDDGIDPAPGLIKCGRNRSTLAGIDPMLYPPTPAPKETDTRFSLHTAELTEAIKRTVFAAADEVARPILTGCQFGAEGDRFWIIATDAFRLALARGDLRGEVEEPLKFTLPHEALDEVRRAMPGDGEVFVTLNTVGDKVQKVVFETNPGTPQYVMIRSQALQGEYPNWEGLIPDHWDTQLVLDSAAIQRLVKLTGIFSAADSAAIRIWAELPPAIRDGDDNATLTVTGASSGVGDLTGKIDAFSWNGNNSRVALNSDYIAEFLPTIESQQIVLEMEDDDSRPAVFKMPDNDDWLYMAMPMGNIDWGD